MFSFKKEDIREDILDIVENANKENLIDITQVFLLGMSQASEDDWENYTTLVNTIENLIPNLDSNTFPNTRKSLIKYYDNRYEAMMDYGCED